MGNTWQAKAGVGPMKGGGCHSGVFEFFLERERLLSRIPANPTVGSLRDKKESCSTWRGLGVGTRFREFPQLREVGVSLSLGFTLYLSVFQCFGWYEALNGRLISPKTWDRIDTIFWSHGAARNCFRGCLVGKS